MVSLRATNYVLALEWLSADAAKSTAAALCDLADEAEDAQAAAECARYLTKVAGVRAAIDEHFRARPAALEMLLAMERQLRAAGSNRVLTERAIAEAAREVLLQTRISDEQCADPLSARDPRALLEVYLRDHAEEADRISEKLRLLRESHSREAHLASLKGLRDYARENLMNSVSTQDELMIVEELFQYVRNAFNNAR